MQIPPSVGRARSWTELLEQLYAGSWNPALQRFRSPFAFRGLGFVDHDLSNSLMRLPACTATSTRSSWRCCETSGSMRMPRRRTASTASGTGLPSRSTMGCRRGWWTGPTRRSWRCTSPRSYPAKYRGRRRRLVRQLRRGEPAAPGRLKTILEQEQSETLTVEMLGEFRSLRAFDLLATRAVRRLRRAAVARRTHPQPVRTLLASLQSDCQPRRWVRRHPSSAGGWSFPPS